MTEDDSETSVHPPPATARLTKVLFLIGLVGWAISIGVRYAALDYVSDVAVGQELVLSDFGAGMLFIAADEQTLSDVMFADCEDVFLPLLSQHRRSTSIAAMRNAIDSGRIITVGGVDSEIKVEVLEVHTWIPQYSGRLLDTPSMLKVRILTGDTDPKVGWISSHWARVKLADPPGSHVDESDISRIAMTLSIVITTYCFFALIGAIREWHILRHYYGRIPFSLQMMMAAYRFTSFRRLFFAWCMLTLVIAVPKALFDPTIPVAYRAFILVLGLLSLIIVFRDTLPPAVVILGASTRENVQFFSRLSSQLKPWKATCLLTAREGLSAGSARVLAQKGLRLANSPHWRLVVTHLLDTVPVAVFVGRESTSRVEEERIYAERNGYMERCVFGEAADTDEIVMKIRELLTHPSCHSLKRGHDKAWKWIKVVPLLYLFGIGNNLSTITQGRRLMLSVLRENGWNCEATFSPFLQSLRDFPELVFRPIFSNCEDTKGMWMVRAIFRGTLDGESQQNVKRPQYLAIAHAMLARLELLANDFELSYFHANEAFGIIQKATASIDSPTFSEIERAELGSLHLCLAESSFQSFRKTGFVEDRQVAIREYESAIKEYSQIEVDVCTIQERVDELHRQTQD